MRIGSGLLVAMAGVVAINTIPTSAAAAPTPDPVQQYKDLSLQAEKLDESLLAAKSDLAAKQVQLQQAKTQLTQAQQSDQQARQQEAQFRGQVDQFTAASFEGARLSQLSALLTGNSAKDFLGRATMLQELAADNNAALAKFQAATNQASAAQAGAQHAEQTVQDSTTAASQLVSTISAKKQALDAQVSQVKAAMAKLTATQQASLSPPPVANTSVFLGAPGVINTVLQAALSRRGDAYVWGATGPSQFDCSGLTQWAYLQGGITLPRVAADQYSVGKYVAYGQWQPGDLIFYGSSAGSIHHVAMYVGNGDIVHAPTTGIPVQVVPISGGGSDYYGAKRIVG